MAVYNKLFTKILDSSIWLEPTPTRIVWITLLAAMDEDGYAHFSAIENLALRARVTVEEASTAIECFISPDPNSGNPDNEGRRIERVPGGYMVLNAKAHRAAVNRIILREQTRIRVARHRSKTKVTTNAVTCSLPTVTPASACVLASSEGKESAERKGGVPQVDVAYHRDSRTVLHLLNEATGRNFRELASNLEVISARLQEPGVTLGGVRKMIARQCARWKGTTQEEFLRPETLFGKTKFDSYYAAGDLPISTDQPGAKPKQESIIDKQIKSLCSPR